MAEHFPTHFSICTRGDVNNARSQQLADEKPFKDDLIEISKRDYDLFESRIVHSSGSE